MNSTSWPFYGWGTLKYERFVTTKKNLSLTLSHCLFLFTAFWSYCILWQGEVSTLPKTDDKFPNEGKISFLTWAFQTFCIWQVLTEPISAYLSIRLACLKHTGNLRKQPLVSLTDEMLTRVLFLFIIKIDMKICCSEHKKSSIWMTFSLNAMQISAVQTQKVPHLLCSWPGIDHLLPLTMKSMAEPSLFHIHAFQINQLSTRLLGFFI